MAKADISSKNIEEKGNNILIITFSGQLDESNIDEKAKEVYQLIDGFQERQKVVLDFDKLEYVNSKGIGYLTDWYTKISQINGTLSIISPKENILDLLQVIGLTQLITTYPSLSDYVAKI